MSDEKLGSVNPTPLLNRTAVRDFLLEVAKDQRPFNKFTRVSEDTLIRANAVVRSFCVTHVRGMPSKGQTL